MVHRVKLEKNFLFKIMYIPRFNWKIDFYMKGSKNRILESNWIKIKFLNLKDMQKLKIALRLQELGLKNKAKMSKIGEGVFNLNAANLMIIDFYNDF